MVTREHSGPRARATRGARSTKRMDAPTSISSNERGVYLFCVTRGELSALPTVPDIEDAGALVRVDAGTLTSVTCGVALELWAGPESEARLSDLEWLGPRALRHELVIERVMALAPVLPLRFGCLFSSTARVREWMHAHADAITRFLDATEGCEEWAVRAWVDTARCRATIADADAPDPARASPGARYLQQKLRERDAGRRAREWLREAERRAAAQLESVALLHRRLPLAGKELRGRSEDPAFNLACLLRRESVDALRERVEALERAWSEYGVSLELTGPWPPYSFCPPLGGEGDDAGDAAR